MAGGVAQRAQCGWGAVWPGVQYGQGFSTGGCSVARGAVWGVQAVRRTLAAQTPALVEALLVPLPWQALCAFLVSRGPRDE